MKFLILALSLYCSSVFATSETVGDLETDRHVIKEHYPETQQDRRVELKVGSVKACLSENEALDVSGCLDAGGRVSKHCHIQRQKNRKCRDLTAYECAKFRICTTVIENAELKPRAAPPSPAVN